MTKKIFEELPARKHAPAAAPATKGRREGSAGPEGSEKKIRQAVYDIRYRARREEIDLRAAFSQYMQNSNLTAQEQAAVREKLFGKDGGGEKKESYNPLMIEGATDVVANALYKVFVEGQERQTVYEEEGGERKYKIRVTDPKTDRSYVRYANRAKITELRAKGLKVEMTEHGEPYEGNRKKKGGLDPVAKNPARRDGDVNNDGKKDKTDSYIYNRRDAINAAIAKKKGMKEEFLADGTTSTEGQNNKKITGNNVDNYSTGIVKINPENEAEIGKNMRMRGIYAHNELGGRLISENTPTRTKQRFLEMISKKEEYNNETSIEVSEEASCPKCGKCPCECDSEDNRAAATYREVLKNKLRSMGKRVVAAVGDDEKAEDAYEKMATAAFIKTDKETGKMKAVSLFGESMVMVADSLIEEGYDEDEIFYAIDNLNEEQMQELEEGLGSLLKAGGKLLKSGVGKKALQKAKDVVKNVVGKNVVGKSKGGKSAISKRAGRVVKDQRAGVMGTDDALNVAQKDLDKSMSRLRRQERRGGQAAASLNAKAVERDVRRAAAYGPQTSSSKPFAQRIDPPKPTGSKPKLQSSSVRPLSYKEMMAQRSKEFAGKSDAEKREIFNQYLTRWNKNNK